VLIYYNINMHVALAESGYDREVIESVENLGLSVPTITESIYLVAHQKLDFSEGSRVAVNYLTLVEGVRDAELTKKSNFIADGPEGDFIIRVNNSHSVNRSLSSRAPFDLKEIQADFGKLDEINAWLWIGALCAEKELTKVRFKPDYSVRPTRKIKKAAGKLARLFPVFEPDI
jgi:hypothetical protein